MVKVSYNKKDFPKLRKSCTDPHKNWVIDYYLFEEATGKKKRMRRQLNATKENMGNAKMRMQEVKEAIKEITDAMKQGAYLPAPALPPTTEPMPETLNEGIRQYLELRKDEADMAKLIRALANRIKKSNVGDLPLPKITATLLDSYFAQLKTETMPRTYNLYAAILKGIFKHFIKKKWLLENPLEDFKQLKKSDSERHTPFTEAQRIEVKQKAIELGYPQLGLMCDFIFYTLARPHRELRDLKVGDIKENTIFFKASTSKNRKSYGIPIQPALEAIIQAHELRKYPAEYYIFGGKDTPTATRYFHKHYFYELHRKVLKALDLQDKNYTVYAHKHSGAIALAKRAKNLGHLRAIQYMCRHHSIAQTETYLRGLGVNLQIDDTEFFM